MALMGYNPCYFYLACPAPFKAGLELAHMGGLMYSGGVLCHIEPWDVGRYSLTLSHVGIVLYIQSVCRYALFTCIGIGFLCHVE